MPRCAPALRGSWQAAACGNRHGTGTSGLCRFQWYVSDGWGPSGTVASTEVYDPQENIWSTAAANPALTLGAGTAVLGGKLYAVGGCTSDACSSATVEVYKPSTDSWSGAADYPMPVSWAGCGTIAGKLYCAGGGTDRHRAGGLSRQRAGDEQMTGRCQWRVAASGA